jgi:hypothetical protein
MQRIGEGITLTDSPHEAIIMHHGYPVFRRYPEGLDKLSESAPCHLQIFHANDERSKKKWHVTLDHVGN